MEHPHAPPSDAGTLRASWHWYGPEHKRMLRTLLFLRWPFRLIVAGIVAFVVYQAARVAWTLATTWHLDPWWLVIGLMWLFVVISATPRAHTAAHEKNHPGPQRVTLFDDGVEMACDVCSLTVAWDGIGQVQETREFFLFLSRGRHYTAYLPKRALDGEAGVQAVRDHVRRRIGARARLKDGAKTIHHGEGR